MTSKGSTARRLSENAKLSSFHTICRVSNNNIAQYNVSGNLRALFSDSPLGVAVCRQGEFQVNNYEIGRILQL